MNPLDIAGGVVSIFSGIFGQSEAEQRANRELDAKIALANKEQLVNQNISYLNNQQQQQLNQDLIKSSDEQSKNKVLADALTQITINKAKLTGSGSNSTMLIVLAAAGVLAVTALLISKNQS